MIFAETERLVLRALEKSELPRLVALLDVWDVVRWLTVVPFPYTMREADALYAEVAASYAVGVPEFFALALKSVPDVLIGGVSLHVPRNDSYGMGEVELGCWLGKDYWGQGLMSEAVAAVINLGFAREVVAAVGANTAPNNQASQRVLRKAGLRELGVFARDYAALRGENQIIKWLMTREEWAGRKVCCDKSSVTKVLDFLA